MCCCMPAGVSKRLGPLKHILQGRSDRPTPYRSRFGLSAGKYEERFQYLRVYRPGGWEPTIFIDGIEHVELEFGPAAAFCFAAAPSLSTT